MNSPQNSVNKTASRLGSNRTLTKFRWRITIYPRDSRHPDNATLERSAVYRFQARWAEQWRNSRRLIASDAAHLMPPFSGEGMCAGFRDAVALAWCLNSVLDGLMEADVLDSYESERIHHAKHYIDFSQELGRIICISDPDEAAERDRSMKAELAARNHEPISGDLVHLGLGIWCEDTPAAGELSTQGVVEYNGVRGRFDQVVGQGWVVLGIGADPAASLQHHQLSTLEHLGGKTVTVLASGADSDVVDAEGTYAVLGGANRRMLRDTTSRFLCGSNSHRFR